MTESYSHNHIVKHELIYKDFADMPEGSLARLYLLVRAVKDYYFQEEGKSEEDIKGMHVDIKKCDMTRKYTLSVEIREKLEEELND